MIYLRQNYETLCFHLYSLSISCTGEQFFQLLLNRWLLFFNHLLFSHVPKIYKWLHYFFWDILIIHDSVYKRDAVTTGFFSLLN